MEMEVQTYHGSWNGLISATSITMRVHLLRLSILRASYKYILLCIMLMSQQPETCAFDVFTNVSDEELNVFLTNISAQCTADEQNGMIRFRLIILHPGKGNEWFLRLKLSTGSTNVSETLIKGIDKRASQLFRNESRAIYQVFEFSLSKEYLKASTLSLFEGKINLDYSIPSSITFTTFECNSLYLRARKPK